MYKRQGKGAPVSSPMCSDAFGDNYVKLYVVTRESLAVMYALLQHKLKSDR